MAEPINPFDDAAVSAAHDARREREQAPAAYPQSASGTPAEEKELTPTQVAAAIFHGYAEQGMEPLAEFLAGITSQLDVIAQGLEQEQATPADPTMRDPDFVLWCAAQGKAVEGSAKNLYNRARLLLWEIAGGVGQFTTPDGLRYEFKRGATSTRSVNYKTLEKDYPDVYDAVVTVKQKSPDTPGTLSL